MDSQRVVCGWMGAALFMMFANNAWAQGSGSAAASAASAGRADVGLAAVSPERALNVISVEGSAEVRLQPEGIRIVLAVLSEGATSQACEAANAERVQALRRQWIADGIAEDAIVEDFVSVLPRYSWKEEQLELTRALVQQLDGYRMQTNLHLAVNSEEAAMSAIRAAFQHQISDIITFDYWSSGIDEARREARQRALAAARDKSEVLLAVFDQRPLPINVDERTRVFLPGSQYRTFTNTLEETITIPAARDNLPRIRAARPQMTFFDGLGADADARPAGAAMNPVITVVSTVRIDYQSPATKSVSRDR